MSKPEFEGNIDKGDYTFNENGLEKATVECVSFICQCLQYDEHWRAGVDQLLKHDFFMVSPADQ